MPIILIVVGLIMALYAIPAVGNFIDGLTK